jgi:hypothetical protein
MKVRLEVNCPKPGCGSEPLKWQWEGCKHPSMLDDEGDVRRLFNTFSYGALIALSGTSSVKLVLSVRATLMEQNMRNILCLPY